ncbi:flagellar type III secretion system protein FliR [Paenibacillus sp. IB182496]|uniref:Flagellar biosynthetic protein FliR n=1 Tax=Paenibacillus sabuli TaxID=2772509 RepID=A0A927BTT0_9BACL|nr:flagellar biosynthetic protein FliR [Paenibacillus sabuli]MBD2845273.1 flagellar type III secretion system protein FliR [Paenibacillus sabuli]
MELFLQAVPIFLLIFCRITSFFVVAPVFSTRGVPTMFKIGLGFFVSLLVYLVYGIHETVVPDVQYPLFIIREILAGLLLGFVAYMFFTVVQTAGSFIDMQMGFGLANVIDPMTGTTSPLLGNFKFIIVVLLFLTMNGHHLLLLGIMRSYDWLPLSNTLFGRIYEGSVTEFLAVTFGYTFMLALQLAAPLVVAMFLTDVGLGFLARVAPQYNVFVIGIPLKILVGFLLLMLLMPGFAVLIGELFERMFGAMDDVLRLMAQPSAEMGGTP